MSTTDIREDEFQDENSLSGGEEQLLGISADLIRGHINTIILRTLYDEDKYGYDIISEIEKKSGGMYSLKQPTLYSALKRLEALEYVESYYGDHSNGGQRKYFRLTSKGREAIDQDLTEWEYSRTGNPTRAALEALIGYLYIMGQQQRMDEILSIALPDEIFEG